MGDPQEAVLAEIDRRRDELVDLTQELIRFDTTARGLDDPPRQEAALQELLADRLRSVGADVTVWEPTGDELAPNRQVPAGISFEGRPQLLARFPGASGGRSLLFNGHIDAVSGEPRSEWTSDPNDPRLVDGRIFGRGACDMKGGVASMVLAAEALQHVGVRLSGDLLVNTVTDEEWNGAGALACSTRGVRADLGLVPEPSGFNPQVACRGILTPTITVSGRPGHAELPQADWQQGGAVNAIEKVQIVLEAVAKLREEWHARYSGKVEHLAPGDLVPTMINGGEWWVTYPASCQMTLDVTYLSAQADENGWGADVEREIEARILERAAKDPWLAGNPPTFAWGTDLPPAAVPSDHEIVDLALAAGKRLGRSGAPAGQHSWHDAATFTRTGTPTIAYGPSGVSDTGAPLPHSIDEMVRVDDLVDCAKAYALIALQIGEA
jgi:acetylornithine deacetylase